MSYFHGCIRSSVSICQSFIDWFSQYPALGLMREALRISINKVGIEDRVFSHCSVLLGGRRGQ